MKWLAVTLLCAAVGGCSLKWPSDGSEEAALRIKVADLENRLALLEKGRGDATPQMATCLDAAAEEGRDYIRRNGGVLMTDKDGAKVWRARGTIIEASNQIKNTATAECQALYGAK